MYMCHLCVVFTVSTEALGYNLYINYYFCVSRHTAVIQYSCKMLQLSEDRLNSTKSDCDENPIGGNSPALRLPG